jgi:hypothetical protein
VISTKNTGTSSTPSTVADTTPPSTATPIAFCAPAPAPLAIASGKTPSTNASEVITIGRSRIRDASIAASTAVLPCSCSSVANSTIRIAFFAARPIVASSPTWKYTSFRSPPYRVASTAPVTPSGTTSITDIGIDQLS